jgi:hypothetical protein
MPASAYQVSDRSGLRRVVIVVSSDPRTSHRPGEAIRIGAGVATWRRVQVTLYLRGAAVLCVSERGAELVDGDSITGWLKLLRESGGRICVDQEVSTSTGAGILAREVERFSVPDLARTAAEADILWQF